MGMQGFGGGAGAGIPKAPAQPPSVFNGRPGIFDQNKRQRVPSASRQGAEQVVDDAARLSRDDEVRRLRTRLEELEKTMKNKDAVIERQRAEITSLRKKNFDARARALEIEDKYKESKE